DRLRRTVTPAEASAVLGLLAGRSSAAAKFEDAARLFIDREAAEQATSETVARHTARRFAGAGRVADLGAGAGGDALAIAEHAPTVAVERDPSRVAMLSANVEVRGLGDRLQVSLGDAEQDALLEDVDAVWLDPGRRDARGRVRDPERWSPPLSTALRLASKVSRAGIKVAPGIDLALAPPDTEVECISLDGTLVETVFWLGTAVSTARRATVLRAGLEGASVAGDPDRGATPVGAPGRYLYDLDPAVGRASLVDAVAPLLHAWRLDELTAYLGGDEAIDSPFARRFRIDTWLPFSERRLLATLRDLHVGRVEVMRRASPVDTNALEVRLNRALARGAHGDAVRTVALTRLQGNHAAVICERC
ncbi:MAG: SAM-dependent methyltransferase, partial [Dehalococcoidia bacterium]